MRADARANRAAVIDAAKRLYAARGANVPFTSIAAEAGVGVATLYRHFPTQTDLVVAIVEGVRDEIIGVCERSAPAIEASPEQGWPRFANALADLRLSAFLPALVEAHSFVEWQPVAIEARARGLAAVGALLAKVKDAGLVDRDVDAAHFMGGMAMVTRSVPGNLQADLPDIQPWLLATFLAGLRPRS